MTYSKMLRFPRSHGHVAGFNINQVMNYLNHFLKNIFHFAFYLSHMLHVWHIYLHLAEIYGKCK